MRGSQKGKMVERRPSNFYHFSCVDKQTEARLQSKSDILIWKTFSLPKNPEQTGIRLSWAFDTPKTDLESVLTFFLNNY